VPEAALLPSLDGLSKVRPANCGRDWSIDWYHGLSRGYLQAQLKSGTRAECYTLLPASSKLGL